MSAKKSTAKRPKSKTDDEDPIIGVAVGKLMAWRVTGDREHIPVHVTATDDELAAAAEIVEAIALGLLVKSDSAKVWGRMRGLADALDGLPGDQARQRRAVEEVAWYLEKWASVELGDEFPPDDLGEWLAWRTGERAFATLAPAAIRRELKRTNLKKTGAKKTGAGNAQPARVAARLAMACGAFGFKNEASAYTQFCRVKRAKK